MAYRDPTFNANVLTDLLGTYLTHKSNEREKYYKAAEDANKTVIRQGADGKLRYAPAQGRAGDLVFPEIEKPPISKSESSVTEEYFDKKTGQSTIIEKRGGRRYDLDGKELSMSFLKNYTKKQPRLDQVDSVKSLKTAYYPDGNTREFHQKGNNWFWNDNNKQILNSEWGDFAINKDDSDEKLEKKTRTAFQNIINKKLKPIYARFNDESNFKQGSSWSEFPEMLSIERDLIQNQFGGKVEVYTSVAELREDFPNMKNKTDEEVIEQANFIFSKNVKEGILPKFYLHTEAFGSESDFAKMMSNFKNLRAN